MILSCIKKNIKTVIASFSFATYSCEMHTFIGLLCYKAYEIKESWIT